MEIKIFLTETIMKIFLAIVLPLIALWIFAYLQRKYSSETLANGFMDMEKGKEIAPTLFKNEE